MEEKVLVKSQQYNAKKGLRIILCVAVALAVLACVGAMVKTYEFYSRWEYSDPFGSALKYWWRYGLDALEIVVLSLVGLTLISGSIIYLWLKSYELVVTDKRVYGKVAFGKRVDLPNDSISAISMVPMLKGVAVATSSGKISFLLIKNADEVYDTMNKLLMQRQEQRKAAPEVAAAPAPSNASELKQYKELLDSGVISQEEFDAKKKQLLGL